MFIINGKVALITGGAKGIGFAFARELLKNGLKGVSIVDIDVENGERASSVLQKDFGIDSVIFIKADISDEHKFEEAFQTTAGKFKQLDIVINNAGIIQEKDWRKCVAINFTSLVQGSMLAMESFLPKYKSGDEGILINISSALGLQPIEEVPIYSATKAGIIGFGRSIGGPLHYKETKVRVLTICPGITDTPISRLTTDQQREPYKTSMWQLIASIEFQSTEDLAKSMVKIIPDAPPGSVWLVSKNNLSQIEFPTIVE